MSVDKKKVACNRLKQQAKMADSALLAIESDDLTGIEPGQFRETVDKNMRDLLRKGGFTLED